jgi:glycosyltransferase involved in cell wall biosynthesis
MERHFKISVVVATYNRDRPLCDTLSCLLAQDYKNYELIVVDQSQRHDPSTTQYLRAHAARICWLRFGPPNLPAARNFGVRSSTGEIIVFCDDDMVLSRDALSSLAFAYSDSAVWGATGFAVSPGMSEDEKIASYAKSPQTRLLLARGEPLVRISECIGCLMSFRRELFDKIGYFDEWLGTQPMGAGEDAEFTTRMHSRGYPLFLVTNLTVTHLGAKQGGCERRTLAPEVVNRAQLRATAYCYLKNRRYPNFIGWVNALWRCHRAFVLNREVLGAGFGKMVSRQKFYLSVVPAMASMARHNLVCERANTAAEHRPLTALRPNRGSAGNQRSLL